MSLSRRALFRGAAAAGMTAATGGAGKAAQGAVMAAGGAAGVLSSGKSIYGVLQELGAKFPHKEIIYLGSSLMKGNEFKTDKAERLRDALSVGKISRYDESHDEINGVNSKSYSGKIDFSYERSLYHWIRDLPQNVPLLDLLSDETYQSAILNGDFGSNDAYGAVNTSNPVQLSALRKMLEPICDGSTTALDLRGNLESYFMKLGRHALNHPDDFVSSVMGGDGGYFNSQLSDLANIVGRISGKPENGELYEQIFAAKKKLKIEKEPWHASRIKQAKIEQQNKRENAEADKLRDTKPSALKIKLRRASETEFVVDQASKIIPSRKDWFNWMKSIDQEDAKICDIKTSHGGFAVTVQNQIAIDFLNAVTDDEHPEVLLEFPVGKAANPEIDQLPN